MEAPEDLSSINLQDDPLSYRKLHEEWKSEAFETPWEPDDHEES